jgi:hypothetical protein
MKIFSPLGGASYRSASEMLHKTANIYVKTYQFKHSVKDDQIIRQKLQISNLLILEIILHVTGMVQRFH